MQRTFDKIVGTGRFESVENLLDKFHSAASVANLDEYFGCFDNNGRFLGTDASENWTAQEFYTFSKPHFDAGSGWTFKPLKGTRKLTYYPSESNPLFCVFDELLDSESFLATSRGSGTLLFNSATGHWLIAQYHLSFPIPNDLAKDMTKSISIFENVKKVKQADDAADRLIAEWDQDEKSSTGDKKTGKSNSKKKNKK